MKASFLIVSKNRKEELSKTLKVLENYGEPGHYEIRVFLDGCTDGSESLKELFPDIHWITSDKSLGASRARNILYAKAKGELLFGFDDDAHPLQPDFVEIAQEIFDKNPIAGIIAFKEIKGVYDADHQIPRNLLKRSPDFLVKDFIACGFVIKRSVYNRTRGFPTWIDIYGEEVCLALETIAEGFDVLQTYRIQVNHRVDKKRRANSGANYFRFGKQLKNTAYFYLVYYPFPLFIKKIGRLYFLNFQKYALKDRKYFQKFWAAFFSNTINSFNIWRVRKPVDWITLKKFNELSNPPY